MADRLTKTEIIPGKKRPVLKKPVATTGSQKGSLINAHRSKEGMQRKTRPFSAPWSLLSSHFLPIDESVKKELVRFHEILETVWPLRDTHRKTLSFEINALSERLTSDRASLSHPYWSHPAAISAYLYYFLPWNLVRLIRLLQSLPLDDPGPDGGIVFDLGSGPLTLPLALWLAKPKLRTYPLTIVAQDRSKQPLMLGKELLAALAGDDAWQVSIYTCGIDSAVRRFPSFCRERHITKPLWLLSAANVLNEVAEKKSRRLAEEEEEEADGEEGVLTERLFACIDACASLLHAAFPEGEKEQGRVSPKALFVEPGTRLGGKIIEGVREAALQTGLFPVFPCAHNSVCPLTKGHGKRTWCHFTFDTGGVPQWLTRLSAEAHLTKEALSLSPLLVGLEEKRDASLARVISSPFFVPLLHGKGRYACSAKGLCLLADTGLAQGDLLRFDDSLSFAERDPKSGAFLLRSSTLKSAQKHGEHSGERRGKIRGKKSLSLNASCVKKEPGRGKKEERSEKAQNERKRQRKQGVFSGNKGAFGSRG